MVALSLDKKTQIGYTQYVDNDVYVDDVDDEEAGAGAYNAQSTQMPVFQHTQLFRPKAVVACDSQSHL